jgi:modulator of FtsH protease HflC
MNIRPLIIVAFIVAFAVFALWIVSASVYTVDETQQALVVRLGKPVGVVNTPGLKFKMPMVDTVIYYDTRLLPLESPTDQIILGDQKRIEVDTYTRYRIADLLLFYKSVRTVEQANAQLSQLVGSSVRRELGREPLGSLLSDKRAKIVDKIQNEVAEKAKSIGIDVVEVRIHRADLPLETSQAIYDRMKSEREREAKELRAQGFELAQQIQSNAERERTVILSKAQRNSKITRSEGDAEAGSTFANAFGKDPQFYKFYRSLQTYRQTLADSGLILVLSPNAEFLHDLVNGPGKQ